MKMNKVAKAIASAALAVVVLAGCGGSGSHETVFTTSPPGEMGVHDLVNEPTRTFSESNYQRILELSWSSMPDPYESHARICNGWNDLGIKDELIEAFYSKAGDVRPPRQMLRDFFDKKCA